MDQRRRRCADVLQMLYKCFVFAGYVKTPVSHFNIYTIRLIIFGIILTHFTTFYSPPYDRLSFSDLAIAPQLTSIY